MAKRFVVRLKPFHDATGKTAYAVAEELGMSKNTVRRYVEEEAVAVGRLDPSIITLTNYYGCRWQDVVEIEEVSDDPEIKPLLAAPA